MQQSSVRKQFGVRSRVVALVAFAHALAISACGDVPTGSQVRPGHLSGTDFQEEGLVVTACQYGGEYPNCKSAPIDDGYDPNLPPAEPTGTSGTGDGGGGGTTTGDTPPPDSTNSDSEAYSKGPLAWGACILGIVASTISVYDVADAFQNWHGAYQDAQGAYNLWQATIQNNADATTQQLYEFQYRQAYQRQQDAANVVSSQTRTSVTTLVGAGIVCGALALAPTP